MIEEQVDIGILACLAPRGRAEEVKVLDAKLLQLGLVLLEPGYGSDAVHICIMTQVAGNSRIPS